jgi:hypothetical protein
MYQKSAQISAICLISGRLIRHCTLQIYLGVRRLEEKVIILDIHLKTNFVGNI